MSASVTSAIAPHSTAMRLGCAEVRERVREAGACRDATPGDAAPKDAAPAPSDAVTMKLSDGTVVRIPREISSNINDGRKRAPTNEPAPPKSAPRAGESAQSKPRASGGPVPALQKLEVPDVIGRSDADAGSALAEFKVDRIETASVAPAGECSRRTAPATLVLRKHGQPAVSDVRLLARGAATPRPTAPPTAPAPRLPLRPPLSGTLRLLLHRPTPASEPTFRLQTRSISDRVLGNTGLSFGAGVLLVFCSATVDASVAAAPQAGG